MSKLNAAPMDPQKSAKAAGLRYVSDEQPGIQRVAHGKGFSYVRPDGKPLIPFGVQPTPQPTPVPEQPAPAPPEQPAASNGYVGGNPAATHPASVTTSTYGFLVASVATRTSHRPSE